MPSEFDRYLRATFGGVGPLPKAAKLGPWAAIWARLTIDERRQASRELIVQSEKLPDALASVHESIAASERTRPEVVARWSVDRQADRFAHASNHAEPNLGNLIATFFVKLRGAMLLRFCDVAEIPNLNAVVDLRTYRSIVPIDRLVAAIRAIDAEFPARDVELYLDALVAQKLPPWTNLSTARALARKHVGPPPSTDPSPIPPGPTIRPAPTSAPPSPPPARNQEFPTGHFDVMVPIDRGEVHLADVERLSPLDALVRESAIATSSHVVGALPPDRIRAVVEELIRCVPDR